MASGLALIDRLAQWPRLSSLGLGLLAATGFQPIGLWPVALIAMGLFALLAADAATPLRAFGRGWLFGWAHFTLGNNWIATAFTFQSEMPEVLGWFAVPLLAIYLAVWPAFAALLARAVVKKRPDRPAGGWAFALVFAGGWIVTEWMRAWVFSGYSWNPFAMNLLGPYDRPGLAAVAPFMGTYALSGLAIMMGCALVLLARERRLLVGGLVGVLLVVGMYLPPVAARHADADEQVLLTIVQPNYRQETISDPAFYEANYARLAQNSPRLDDGTAPRLVLWPEAGLSDYLREGYPQRYYDRTTALGDPVYARRRIGATIGEGSVLLTGAVDLEIGPDENGYVRALGARNAVTALDAEGNILGGYSKAHLVPYGEYLPMRELLEPLGLTRLVAGSIDFWPGPGPRTLDLGAQGRAGIQVCYEIVFSGEVADPDDRPDYIVNASSEGWFGSFGPPQFLAQSRMRAIEEGLPVLRATTTGVSAVIDPRGVVREHLGEHVQGRLDTVIPPAASPTLFARLGNMLALVWAVIFLSGGLVALRQGHG